MTRNAQLGLASLGVIAVGVAAWLSFARHPTNSEIEVCRFVTSRELDEAAALWRARARGEPKPDADAKSNRETVCAPLYAEPTCRAAFEARASRSPAEIGFLVSACRDAYCGKLSPKPALCDRDPKGMPPTEWLPLWRELDEAILKHDLGARAAPVLEARHRGGEALKAAMAEYAAAGAPAWRSEGSDLDVRMTGPGRIEMTVVRDGGGSK